MKISRIVFLLSILISGYAISGCTGCSEDPLEQVSQISGETDGAYDNDIDNDGIANGEDNDVDGDGKINALDDDIDGDGVKNGNDSDVDGDGLANHEDSDIDGDGLTNGEDSDVDGDGLTNGEDSDIDGDGLSNEDDGDIDGDGLNNHDDDDVDGDGLNNDEDDDIDGDGISNDDDDTSTGEETDQGEPTDIDDGNDDGSAVMIPVDHSFSFVLDMPTNGLGEADTTSPIKTQDIRDDLEEGGIAVEDFKVSGLSLITDGSSDAVIAKNSDKRVVIQFFIDGEIAVESPNVGDAFDIVTMADLKDGIVLNEGLFISNPGFEDFVTVIKDYSKDEVDIKVVVEPLDELNISTGDQLEIIFTLHATTKKDI